LAADVMADMASSGLHQASRGKSIRRRIVDSWKRHARRYVVKLVSPYVTATAAAQLHSFDAARQLRVTFDSMDYADTHMQGATVYSEKSQILQHALQQVQNDRLFLEFGVQSGTTINFIAERHRGLVHGFDSFEGLPEDWIAHRRKGAYTTHGRIPEVRSNVRLHVGLFEQTLPDFAREHNEPVAFMHVDCDLYLSTKTIFKFLGDRIVSGTVIVFDEYFNYPGWREHEYRAFQDLVSKRNFQYRYLTYNQCDTNVATIIV
jgi:hypothetical protein